MSASTFPAPTSAQHEAHPYPTVLKLCTLFLADFKYISCPSGGGGTREAGGTSALSGGYASDSGRAEGSSIVDEPGEC